MLVLDLGAVHHTRIRHVRRLLIHDAWLLHNVPGWSNVAPASRLCKENTTLRCIIRLWRWLDWSWVGIWRWIRSWLRYVALWRRVALLLRRVAWLGWISLRRIRRIAGLLGRRVSLGRILAVVVHGVSVAFLRFQPREARSLRLRLKRIRLSATKLNSHTKSSIQATNMDDTTPVPVLEEPPRQPTEQASNNRGNFTRNLNQEADESIARKMFFGGLLLLPWLHLVSVIFYRKQFMDPSIDPKVTLWVRRSFMGFLFMTTLFIAWAITFQLKWKDFGWAKIVMVVPPENLDVGW